MEFNTTKNGEDITINISGDKLTYTNHTTNITRTKDMLLLEGSITVLDRGEIRNANTEHVDLINAKFQYQLKGVEGDALDDAHSAVIDGYQDINETGFSIRLNLGWDGSNYNFFTFSSNNYSLTEDITNKPKIISNLTSFELVNNIIPCSGDSDSNDCDIDYAKHTQEHYIKRAEIKAHNFEARKGWDLKALRHKRPVSANYFTNALEVWKFEDEQWFKTPVEINPKQGFWIKHEENSTYFLPDSIIDNIEDVSITEDNIEETIENNKDGCNLLGSADDVPTYQFKKEITIGITFQEVDKFLIWSFKDGVWKSNTTPLVIDGGSGFWLKSLDTGGSR